MVNKYFIWGGISVLFIILLIMIILFIWWIKLRKIKKGAPEFDNKIDLHRINFDPDYLEKQNVRRYKDGEERRDRGTQDETRGFRESEEESDEIERIREQIRRLEER